MNYFECVFSLMWGLNKLSVGILSHKKQRVKKTSQKGVLVRFKAQTSKQKKTLHTNSNSKLERKKKKRTTKFEVLSLQVQYQYPFSTFTTTKLHLC